MPHQNGKIFTSTSSSGVKLGIDVIDDIAYVLGRSTGDLGQLCGDVNASGQDQKRINKWSKFKPVRDSRPGYDTQSGVENGGTFRGFSALVNPYSSIILQGGDVVQVVSKYDSPTAHEALWAYQKPRGESRNPKEYYRSFDFNGYVDGAICPTRSFAGGGGYAPGSMATFTLVATFNATDGSLGLSDFNAGFLTGDNVFYGIIVRKQNGSKYYLLTGTRKMSEGQNYLTFTFTETGTYYVYPIICSSSFPIVDEDGATMEDKYTYYEGGIWYNYEGTSTPEDMYILILPDNLKLGPNGTMGKVVVSPPVSPWMRIVKAQLIRAPLPIPGTPPPPPDSFLVQLEVSKGSLTTATFTNIQVTDTSALTWPVSSATVTQYSSVAQDTISVEPTQQTFLEYSAGTLSIQVRATCNGTTYYAETSDIEFIDYQQ